jgi:hypothetical protein
MAIAAMNISRSFMGTQADSRNSQFSIGAIRCEIAPSGSRIPATKIAKRLAQAAISQFSEIDLRSDGLLGANPRGTCR